MAGWRSGNDIASGTGGFGFDFRAGQIRRRVANSSPPLRYFFRDRSCVTQALSCGDGPRNSLQAWTLSGEYNGGLILICNKCTRKAKMF